MGTPTLYINIFRDRLGHYFANQDAFTNEKDAISDAESFDRYAFTLTDAGRIDLSPKFSEEWHENQARLNALSAKEDMAMDRLRPMETINMEMRHA